MHTNTSPVPSVDRHEADLPAAAHATPFSFHGVIGRGTHGVVFRATDRRTGAELAVKVLSGRARSREHLMGFTQERLLDLEHPCIVSASGGFDDGEVACLAMELVDGPDLAAHIASRRGVRSGEAVAIAIDVLAALSHAHERGVIHRDVRPENVLLDPSTGTVRARLADFGSAMLLDGPRLNCGAIAGTAGYIAPEVLDGDEADERSDLYSVGRLVVACVGSARMPRALRRWVEWMTHPDPERRPASAAAASSVLRRVIAAVPLAIASLRPHSDRRSRTANAPRRRRVTEIAGGVRNGRTRGGAPPRPCMSHRTGGIAVVSCPEIPGVDVGRTCRDPARGDPQMSRSVVRRSICPIGHCRVALSLEDSPVRVALPTERCRGDRERDKQGCRI